MQLRFPLYARILAWFFLNLVMLAAAFFLLLRAQFHSGFDWLLAAGAGQRIQAVSDLVLADLADRPRSEWNEVLKRFQDAYRLEFFLFRDNDGGQLAGDPILLPPEVRVRIPGLAGLPPRNGPPEALAPRRPPEVRPDRPLPAPGPLPGENPKFVVRTFSPTRYWVLVRVSLQGPLMNRPLPATLAIVSSSLSAGGLFFDYRPWLVVGAAAIFFSGLFWVPLVRSLTRSLGQMTQATRQIAEGRFDGRVDEQRRDELGALGQSINRMAERLAGFVSGQKRFLGDIAHELCAPIARIQVALGILEQRADERNRDYVNDLREEVQHMSKLVNELLSFSKASLGAEKAGLKAVALRPVVEEAVGRENPGGLEIGLEVPGELVVLAEPELLGRALANLVRNAVRYAGQAGPITLAARREAGEVLITVADSGPGVPEAELARIFDPFYRLDPSRNEATGGVGLGLAIVKTCVESCGGTVTCRNRTPSGLEVTLRLSAAPAGGGVHGC